MSRDESTLTDLIAEAHKVHIFDKSIAECRCGVEMNLTGHRTREHRAHLARVVAAVVSDWLEDPDTQDAGKVGALAAGAPRSALAFFDLAAFALAAEARKGADQ